MTTANKLTMLRIFLIPVFLVILYLDFPGAKWYGLGVFIFASITDFVDGYIARNYNQITDFGKFMDPLADKMLTIAAMCWFVDCGSMAGWVLAVVLLREFAVSGMRLVAADGGRVIAAGLSGKVKTFATMVCLCVMMVISYTPVNLACQGIILATTLYSGAEYFMKNSDVFGSA